MDTAQPFSSIAVIGGGAWGTALGNLCAHNGVETMLWAREPSVVKTVNESRENTEFLPGAPLSPRLTATGDLAEAARQAALIFVVPAQHARPIFAELRRLAAEDAPVALCSKGVERDTGLLMTEVLREV